MLAMVAPLLPFILLTPALRWALALLCPPKGHVPTLASTPPMSPHHRGLTASTRLLALPWNCLLLPAVWLGTVRDTGLALLGLPQSELSGNLELQCTEGKLLLSFSLDSAPSRRSVGMGCCGQPRLQGVAGGVAHSRENVVGEWLRWRRGLRPATANACRERGHTWSEGSLKLQAWDDRVLEELPTRGPECLEAWTR